MTKELRERVLSFLKSEEHPVIINGDNVCNTCCKIIPNHEIDCELAALIRELEKEGL